jgi:hypothetical protein
MHSSRLPTFAGPTNFPSYYLHLLGQQTWLPIFCSMVSATRAHLPPALGGFRTHSSDLDRRRPSSAPPFPDLEVHCCHRPSSALARPSLPQCGGLRSPGTAAFLPWQAGALPATGC